MGPSGSGKSTLAKLLQGFYQPSGGSIKIDGNDIRYLSANELRSHFGVVPQETVLFSGTIYDNLMMANPHATFDQVVQPAKWPKSTEPSKPCRKATRPKSASAASDSSGGQKQRIAIARACSSAQDPDLRRSHQRLDGPPPNTSPHHQPA